MNINRKIKYLAFTLVLIFAVNILPSQQENSKFKIARVKYSGGGDWYNDPSSEINLLEYIDKQTNIPVDPKYVYVDLASDNLFQYPMIYLTGHGNLKFSDTEIIKLRTYLQNGGFLYIDDDYGLDEYIREEMHRVFPNQDFVELPFSHGIYNIHYNFPNGLPKVHEHDKKPPKGYGLFFDGRLCVYYTFESNLGDGWADERIHQDPQKKREDALKMGTNIVVWALSN